MTWRITLEIPRSLVKKYQDTSPLYNSFRSLPIWPTRVGYLRPESWQAVSMDIGKARALSSNSRFSPNPVSVPDLLSSWLYFVYIQHGLLGVRSTFQLTPPLHAPAQHKLILTVRPGGPIRKLTTSLLSTYPRLERLCRELAWFDARNVCVLCE